VNFDLSEDELMLKGVAERFVADRYDPENRRAYRAEIFGFSHENWALLGELGLIGAAFSPDSGGMGSSACDLAILFEALGRGMVVEPLIDSVLIAGRLFERVAKGSLKSAWIDDLVAGKRRLALAHREYRGRSNAGHVETRAIMNGHNWSISGEKSMVLAGPGADGFIVSARTGEGDVRLFLVKPDGPGVSTRNFRMLDGSSACQVNLKDAIVNTDQLLDGGLEDIAAIEAGASVARSAEALGIMETLFASTIDYLRARTQFGASLGSFQAIQHRMVAQYAVIEQARSLLTLAAMAESGDDIPASGARAFISDASVTFGHEMIQMHGGMGVSDELAIGHGHKRLMLLSRWPEDAKAALDRYAGVA
jgi:alkylation response protein AidB-like acyl-CoA dehydrogenase